MQGVKGETLKTDPRRFFWAILCRTLGQLSVRHVHARARPMKICQNGHGHRYHGHHHGLGHDHRCHAMLVFISPTAEGHVAHLTTAKGSLLLKRSCPACICDTAFYPPNFLARPHVGFPKEEIELNFKRVKRKHNHRQNSYLMERKAL